MFILNEGTWTFIGVVLILIYMVGSFVALVLGMILSGFGKEPVASRLIKFGAGSGAIFFGAYLVFGAIYLSDPSLAIWSVVFVAYWLVCANSEKAKSICVRIAVRI